MKKLIALMTLFALSFMAFSVWAANPTKEEIQDWVADLPNESSLKRVMGEKGCDAISFPQNSKNGTVSLKFGKILSHDWLGIKGRVALTPTTLTQDFYGVCLGAMPCHISIKLVKSGRDLTVAQYYFYEVNPGSQFRKEVLLRHIACEAK